MIWGLGVEHRVAYHIRRRRGCRMHRRRRYAFRKTFRSGAHGYSAEQGRCPLRSRRHHQAHHYFGVLFSGRQERHDEAWRRGFPVQSRARPAAGRVAGKGVSSPARAARDEICSLNLVEPNWPEPKRLRTDACMTMLLQHATIPHTALPSHLSSAALTQGHKAAST